MSGTHTQAKRIIHVLKKASAKTETKSYSALSNRAKDALRLLFLRETASAYPEELRKIMHMGFSLEQSCAAIGACKDSERVAELAMSLLLDCLAQNKKLPAPSAAFRGRVTDILQSGKYMSEADVKTIKALRAQEQKRLVKVLHAANVQDGTRGYSGLSTSAKALLTQHYVVETAAAFPSETRRLLELGFSLKDSAAALGARSSHSHLLETSLCRLLEAGCLQSFDTERRLPCPSVEFRSRVTQLLRSGDYVSESAAREEQKWLLLVLKQCGVSDHTLSWAALPDSAQEALHQVFMRQTAANYPWELRQLLTLGFPLVGCCAALGSCSLQPGSRHIVETCVLKLLDDTVPLWAPSAKFRGRITSLLRSGAYVTAESKEAAAETTRAQNKKLLRVLADSHVRGGTKNWCALTSSARTALHKHMIAEVGAEHPYELRKLLETGFSLPAAAAAIYSAKCRAAESKQPQLKQHPHRTLNAALDYLLAGGDRLAVTGPPAEFRGRVTRLLRSGAYIHIGAPHSHLLPRHSSSHANLKSPCAEQEPSARPTSASWRRSSAPVACCHRAQPHREAQHAMSRRSRRHTSTPLIRKCPRSASQRAAQSWARPQRRARSASSRRCTTRASSRAPSTQPRRRRS